MKRQKHITINLNDEQYNAINLIAQRNNRKIADVAYLIIMDQIEKLIINYVDESNAGFKKMHFDPYSDYIK